MSFDDKTHGPGEGAVSYGTYLRVAELTSLQRLSSEPMHHDEMLFIVVHQTYELWFKQFLHEVDTIVPMMSAGQVLAAGRLIGRCVEIVEVMIRQVSVLETMTPMDFMAFRDNLQPASGFQSLQFREIELALGMRDDRVLNHFQDDADARERIARRIAREPIPEVLFALLRARGFDTPALPEVAGEPAVGPVRARRVAALATLYANFESHYDLFMLCEALLELDQQLLLWRQRHIMMVERVIGGRRGTGGSSGSSYLKTTLDKRAFPELWDVRTAMSTSHAY